jgi:hypothetical protein
VGTAGFSSGSIRSGKCSFLGLGLVGKFASTLSSQVPMASEVGGSAGSHTTHTNSNLNFRPTAVVAGAVVQYERS